MDNKPYRRSPAKSKPYDYSYMRFSYLISHAAYDSIKTQAHKDGFVATLTVPLPGDITPPTRGISHYINSVTLTPNFTEEDKQFIEGSKQYGYDNPVWLTGDPRVQRKLLLSDECRQYLAHMGLQYKLYQKQATDTALISGVLEAWGNGKFTAKVNESHAVRNRYDNAGYHKIMMTRKQWAWLNKCAQDMQYEPPYGAERKKSHRGLAAFIKDLRYVDLEPYPFDKSIADPHPNVPPLRDDVNDDVYFWSYKTHPQLQAVIERDLWIPILPAWYDCLPTTLDPSIETLKAATQ